MNCGSCKHWKQRPVLRAWGQCDHPTAMVYENAYTDSIEAENNSLVYMDGDGFNIRPLVGKNFGCIHYEAKL